MTILLVTQNYAPFVGGIETHARQVAHGLGAAGHRVQVAAMGFAPPRLPRRLGVLSDTVLARPAGGYCDDGVPVAALAPAGPLDRLRLLPAAVRAVPVVQRYAYERLFGLGYPWFRSVYLPRLTKLARGADVVHALCGNYLGWAAQEAARAAGAAFVCTPFVHPGQWGDDRLNVAYYRRSDGVVALLGSDRQVLRSLGVAEERLHVVGVSPDLPPAQDPAGFRRRHGLGSDPTVLYVGRMMPQKGAAATVAAAPLVWRSVPRARFVFVGPPSAESAAWFDWPDDRLKYLGRVDPQEKADALAACDVFCMPSVSEILPTVYLEAWSLGKPVVGGEAHGLRELVEGNAAGVVAPQDPPRLAEALTLLLNDPGARLTLGRNGRRLVEREYSVSAVCGALLGAYRVASEGRADVARPPAVMLGGAAS